MVFNVNQSFDASASEVFDCYESARFVGRLGPLGPLGEAQLVDRTERGDRTVVRTRMTFVADLPAAARAIVDRDKLAWIEEATYDRPSLTATVRFLPDHYANKFEAAASTKFYDLGTGSVRAVSGDPEGAVPLVGRQAERAIVSGLVEYLESEAVVVARHLAEV